jgi:hypothetical protein
LAFLAGQILTASALEEETNNSPYCSVYHSTTQVLTTAVVTSMSANSERADWSVTAMHDTAVNNSRITVQKAGWYTVNATVRFPANGAGRRALEFWVNNATQWKACEQPAHSGGDAVLNGVWDLDLAVADYVQVRAFQDSGGNLSAELLQFSLKYLRD